MVVTEAQSWANDAVVLQFQKPVSFAVVGIAGTVRLGFGHLDINEVQSANFIE